MSHRINLVRLGTISYQEGLKQQARYAEIVKQEIEQGKHCHFLLELEHNPVYTIGIRSSTVTPEEEARLRASGADFHRTSRGGLITFHGPGQLVMYPIVSLKGLREDGGKGKVVGVRRYVEGLEESIIRTVRSFGVPAVDRREGYPGVWVEGRKVASLGVSVVHSITGHGLALNVNNDLHWFHKITACGIEGVEITTLSKEADRPLSVAAVSERLVTHFCQVFHLKCVQDQPDLAESSSRG